MDRKWEINICNASVCSSQAQTDQPIITTLSELFIPAKSLAYGIYELKLTITMIASPNLTTPASTYIKIIPSSIQGNLIQLATSLISLGHQQNLTLNPGMFSIDPDAKTFNASVSWSIQHQTIWAHSITCRIGIISTTAEFIISTISHSSTGHSYQLKIRESVFFIHRAFPTDQVWFIILSSMPLFHVQIMVLHGDILQLLPLNRQ